MNKMRIFGTIFTVILLFSLNGCNTEINPEKPDKATIELRKSHMQSVCELATLECYYHNTAKIYSEKQVLFWNTSKKLWIEYSGKVKLGVDFNKLDMSVDDNVVTIIMPEAKVISCVVDDASLSEDSFYSETKGLGGEKVSAEDQTKAFQIAQEVMMETVQEDESLLLQARVRAQTLLENYVKNIGDVVGVEYEVRWEIVTEDGVDTSEQALD